MDKKIEKILQEQQILNSNIDKFIKKNSKKMQEKNGVVHTPFEIAFFIIDSTDLLNKNEFNKSVFDKNIKIVDPFGGMGTFVVAFLLRCYEKKRENLEYKFLNDIFFKEIIADTFFKGKENIENVFFQLTGKKIPFKNAQFADTFNDFEEEENEDGSLF